MASDDLWAYDQLHREGYGTARMDSTRAGYFAQFIEQEVPKGATILDASCGRGILLKALREAGYQAMGTEASEYLIAQVLPPLPVIKLTYSELCNIEDQSADVVVSNDVLEHLDNEAAVFAALSHLVRISRRWVLVSVGLNEARRIVKHKEVKLHRIVQPAKWWQQVYERYCTTQEDFHVQNSYFLFGERKECTKATL